MRPVEFQKEVAFEAQADERVNNGSATAVRSTLWVAGAWSARVRQLRPIISVDLGFSASKRSTGIAILPAGSTLQPCRTFTFGDAINRVAEAIQSSNESVLILESPLSGCFGSNGNPCARVPFESQSVNGKRATRYWYSGSGATMMLACQFFLRQLDRRLLEVAHKGRIHVFEGFLSFKKRASEHASDADRLLSRFLSSSQFLKVEATPDQKLVSILDSVGNQRPAGVPPEVVVVEEIG